MAYVSGQMVLDREAAVSIYDLGYQYGIGVFERTRTFRERRSGWMSTFKDSMTR